MDGIPDAGTRVTLALFSQSPSPPTTKQLVVEERWRTGNLFLGLEKDVSGAHRHPTSAHGMELGCTSAHRCRGRVWVGTNQLLSHCVISVLCSIGWVGGYVLRCRDERRWKEAEESFGYSWHNRIDRWPRIICTLHTARTAMKRVSHAVPSFPPPCFLICTTRGCN